MIRPDFIFSYWIFSWYLLYQLNMITYNPKFVFILGLIENAILLLLMIKFGTNIKTIIFFIVINIIIKVLPLYTLKNDIIQYDDVYFTFGLFGLFGLWLHLNNENLVGNLKLIHDSLVYGKGKTHFILLLKKIQENFKNW